jgi:hypothetical protein
MISYNAKNTIAISLGVTFFFIVIVSIFLRNIYYKPSICDCNQAAKRHLWNNDDGKGEWQNCCDSYRYEIENYGFKKIGEFEVDIYEVGIGYFADECTPFNRL